ncbi:DotI/IcmL family type IV secretion protein [Brucella sp. HL-2]|nr:DotI/IcmL family type IV secretion protein [Brucella sp. HL-2]MCV9909547.1 DotI/IcmL family type IV secretion protein [Brucella sp. HL-2]
MATVVKKNLWRMIYFASALLVLSVLTNGVLFYALFYKYPVNKFLWTSDARSVCTATTLQEPNISAALVKDFANRVALGLNSYDYINWRRALSTTLDSYFTKTGRSSYTRAFEDSGILERVRKNYYVVTAVSADEPVITQEGLVSGRYTWVVEVPLTIYYRTNIDVLPENRILTFTIVRVDPSPANPNGIAVDGVISRQRVIDRSNLQ